MEITEVITVLRRNGLTIRSIATVVDVPKSTVHRLLTKQPYITVIENDPDFEKIQNSKEYKSLFQ